ncbi:transglycosylase SLT domain-containing protein [Leptolyngbya sp. AN02str]|uniref:transglycosylase SLT domain-containing protein n=1 Tax=Leptolyngbya sp. AN02str TaxID=3423363 RepID=UPI003D3218A9
MLKRRKREVVLAVGAGVTALTLGAAASTLASLGMLPLPWLMNAVEPALELQADESSQVLSLATLPAAERAATLQMLAQSGQGRDRHQARFLLAHDLIQQGQGGSALPLLEGLEQDYPLLAAQILALRAQAQTAASQTEQAQATWQTLLQQHPEDPAAAEGLYALGRSDRTYWQQAIEQFPAHPRTLEIAQTLLTENPNQPQLLLILARYGIDLPGIGGVLGRLTTEYAAQLTPQDWEAIAFAHWETLGYNDAGRAYARAPRTAVNVYRAGRGAHLGNRRADAVQFYRQVVQEFPDAPEAAIALLRLADLARQPEEALPYLETVVSRFPHKAGDAMLKKSKWLDDSNSPQSASQARQMLLRDYSKSEAAAELRWSLTEKYIEAGDIQAAWGLARQIATENPDSEYAPQASFWIGKWAQQMGREAEAKTAYEFVLSRYPESYYAWRSAVMLGWDVGDFTTVRNKLPEIQKPSDRPVPPAGSDALKELYQLGLNREAYARWQVEFTNLMQPTVAEQFTDGLMRLSIGDNLDGIFMVSSLRNRELPEEIEAYNELKRQPAYWEALYPFPYERLIEQWSAQRQLNPMLVTALIRQESRFEPQIKSVVGATGLMQVMPETGAWIASQTGDVDYDLSDPNDNISFGTWYLNYTHETYSNHSLLAVASYNAGPGAVAGWVERFSLSDPDRFVDQIPYPETRGYVESVFENYWNYLRLYNPTVSNQLAKYAPDHIPSRRLPNTAKE